MVKIEQIMLDDLILNVISIDSAVFLTNTDFAIVLGRKLTAYVICDM
jgi:hypothetical protein